jgi:hypothetical protein
MRFLALLALATSLPLAPTRVAAQTLECPIVAAHICEVEKCRDLGEIPPIRIDVSGKKVCATMGTLPCETWEAADRLQVSGSSITVVLFEQSLFLWIDRMKLTGSRVTAMGIAAFFGECNTK